jgi:hypothetical protein
MATIKNRFNKFQHGRTSVFDEPPLGAPKTATTEENIEKIHDLVLVDRRLKVHKIAETVDISKDCMGYILQDILGIKKVSARWLPRLLFSDNQTLGPNWTNWAKNCCLIRRFFLDLVPCDFFLFPNLKKSLPGQKFESIEQIWVK